MLILPVLIPSWRFFKEIEPSPRVQWALVSDDASTPDWQEFRPRPQHVTLLQMALRLFWNPGWNETLFIVSCAERITQYGSHHSINEIRQRIQRDIDQLPIDLTEKLMRFRLVFVSRGETGLTQEVLFLSETYPVQTRVT
ncbi:MAG: hypothetical protein ABJL72_14760 [Roseobacter sp.]